MKASRKPTSPDAITTARILGLLRERHSDQEWSFFEELATSGTEHERYIDGFAMHLWASKKWRRIAYEIKVSRADLMGELDRKPEKRVAAMEVSNQFFYVVPTGLFDKRELPQNCGLIEAHKSGLRVKVAARYREIGPPSHAFVARMLQRMQGYARPDVSCFKYAGREMTEEEFRKFAEDSMPAQMEVAIGSKVHDEVERWKRGNNVVEIIDYLKKEMTGGVWSGTNLEDLKEWIGGIRKGVPIKDLRHAEYQMRGAVDAMASILLEIPEEKDPDDEEEETKDFHIGLEGKANPVPGTDGEGDSVGSKDADQAGDAPTTPAP